MWIRVRDVAHVRDGNDPQQNIVRQDGCRLLAQLSVGNVHYRCNETHRARCASKNAYPCAVTQRSA